MNRKDKWALGFVTYFLVVILPGFVVLAIMGPSLGPKWGPVVFLGVLSLHAAVTLFVAWRRGDL